MTNSKNKIIQPRAHTPLPGAPARTSTTRLPDDLLSEHVQRIAVAGAVGAGLWMFGLVMDAVVFPLTLGAAPRTLTVVMDILGIAVSAGMFLYIRHTSLAPQTKADVGLVFMVLNAVFVALVNSQARTVTNAAMGHVSWNTIVILVGSMILPTTPRKMLAAALVAASMDPLGVWLAHLRGIAGPVASSNTFVLFMPNYACAVVAILPSHVLQRIGRRLRQAQDMGSYHLVELLGRGGMGEVWRAEHHGCWRAAPPSSSCARSCSAPAPMPRRGRCSAGSSAKRRPRRR